MGPDKKAKKRIRPDESPLDSDIEESSTFKKSCIDRSENIKRCGKIINMRLINFMCHSNLHVIFNSHSNMLVGQNGSGKSAIITALILVLGGRARDSQRSSCIQDLIKKGETSAKIEITIANDGQDAFEPHIYGKTINVTRTINQSSTYTIKNERGGVISRKAEDLDRILLYHNLQVNNPVFVLNQDSARNFFKHMTPSKNYSMFLKATQIDTITLKLDESLQLQTQMASRLKSLEKILENKNKNLENLKSRLDKIRSFEKIREHIEELENALRWLKVIQYEKLLQANNEEIKILVEKKSKIEKFVVNKSSMSMEFKKQIKDAKKVSDDAQNDFREIRSKYEDCKKKVFEQNIQMNDAKGNIDNFKKHQSNMEKDIEDISNNISKSNASNVIELRKENELKLNDLRENDKINQNAIQIAQNDLREANIMKNRKQEEMSEMTHKISTNNNNIVRLSAEVRSSRPHEKNKLLVFGEHVIQMDVEINNAHKAGKFRALPRGPIGRYVDVLDGNYRDLVEQQLGNILQFYVVDNTDDRRVLDALANKVSPEFVPAIITSKFYYNVMDYSSGAVTPTKDTVVMIDVIKCCDPVVMNCLIDHCHIESILLTKNKVVAENVTLNQENVPQNLLRISCELPNGIYAVYYPDPRFRVYSSHFKGARILQVDVQGHLKRLQLQIDKLQEDKVHLNTESIAIRTEMINFTKILNDKHQEIEELESKSHEIRNQIFELENYEYPDNNFINVLTTELKEKQSRLEQISELIKKKQNDFDQMKEQLDTFERSVTECKRELQTKNEEWVAQQNVVEELEVKLRNVDVTFLQYEMDLNEITKELQIVVNKKEATLSEVVKAKTEAEALGPRVETDFTIDDLKNKILKKKKSLEVNKSINDDPNVLIESIVIEEQTIKESKRKNGKITQLLTVLTKSLHTRYHMITVIRDHMRFVVEYAFRNLLHGRHFEGGLKIDDEKKTLTMNVLTHRREKSNAASSVSSLSGGERSFTTIALLISLWACADHAFYFLDEYDVFTDDFNRELINQLLLTEAELHPHRQYAFLTPQNMSIKSTDKIKIHNLAKIVSNN